MLGVSSLLIKCWALSVEHILLHHKLPLQTYSCSECKTEMFKLSLSFPLPCHVQDMDFFPHSFLLCSWDLIQTLDEVWINIHLTEVY